MKARLYVFPMTVVDCTSDPHPVDYDTLDEALTATMEVCESPLVRRIRYVTLTLAPEGDGEKRVLEGPYYRTWGTGEVLEKAAGPEAEAEKVAGLWFYPSEVEQAALPPGLSGVRKAMEIARQAPDQVWKLEVAVVWAFAGDASCSDRMTLKVDPDTGGVEVNYSNQDSWTGLAGYLDHCGALSELLGAAIEPAEEIVW